MKFPSQGVNTLPRTFLNGSIQLQLLSLSLTHQCVEPRDARELLERGAAVARLQNHHLGALPPFPQLEGERLRVKVFHMVTVATEEGH